MNDRPKQVIYISEKILISGKIPADFLNAEQFDLCSIQTLGEISILAQAKVPNAIIIGLDFSKDELDQFCMQTQALRKNGKVFSLIALLTQPNGENFECYFSMGFNAVFPMAVAADEIRLELESLLGLQFRKFPRKSIQMKAAVQHKGINFETMADTINQECVVIKLPDNHSIIEQDTLKLDLNADHLNFNESIWCSCWRIRKDRAVLRFISPSEPFIQQIQNLPERESEKIQREISKPVESKAVDLSNFQILDLEASFNQFKTGSGEQSFKDKEQEKLKNLIETDAQKAKAYLGAILLQQQADRLATLMMSWKTEQVVSAKEVFRSHSILSKKLVDQIQLQISACLKDGILNAMNELNLLKTDLQKPIASMQKLFDMKNMVQIPKTPAASSSFEIPQSAPKKIPKTEQRIKETPRTKPPLEKIRSLVSVGFVIILSVGTLWYAFSQYAEPRKRLSTLSANQLLDLSVHVAMAEKYKSKDQTNLKIIFKGSWNQLGKQERDQTLKELRDKFLEQGIQYVDIFNQKGTLVTRYSKGKYRSWSGNSLKSSSF